MTGDYYVLRGSIVNVKKWEPPASGGFWFPGYTVTVEIKESDGNVQSYNCMCRGMKYSGPLARCRPGQTIAVAGVPRLRKFRDESGKL